MFCFPFIMLLETMIKPCDGFFCGCLLFIYAWTTFSLIVHVMVADLGEMSTLEDSIKAALCKVQTALYTFLCTLI